MDELSNILLEIYLKNLNFLENNFPELFKKIATLESMIDSGQYEERWSLEYVDDRYFDIKNIKSGNYYYQLDSFEYSKDIANSVDFSENETFSTLHKYNNILKTTNSDRCLDNIIEFINSQVDFNNIKFTNIGKYIFYGTALGIHIDYIFDNINPTNILIIEPDIEIFRLSMFVTNYSKIENNNHKLFLSVGDDELDRRKKLQSFYLYQPYFNFNIKYKILDNSYRYLIDETLTFLSSKMGVIAKKEFNLRSIKRTIDIANNRYRFITKQSLNKDLMINSTLPVIVISGGPSVDKNLEYIKNIQSKVYIIAVNIIVKRLVDFGIKPDLIVVVDPREESYDTLKDIDSNILKDTLLIATSHIYEKTFTLFEKKNCFILQTSEIYKDIGYLIFGDNVGAIGLSLAIMLKFQTIYTLGNDAAYDEKTGKFYANDTVMANKTTLKNLQASNNKSCVTKSDIISAKGNFRDSVHTTRDFLRFRNENEYVVDLLININNYKSKLYNLSDGVYTKGLEPKKIEDIKFEEDIQKDINLLKESLYNLSTLDIDNDFTKETKSLQSILNMIESYKSKEISNIEQFLNMRLEIIDFTTNNILELNQFILDMFDRFLMVDDNYINFYISLDTHKDIPTVKKLWIVALEDLLYTILKIINKDT